MAPRCRSARATIVPGNDKEKSREETNETESIIIEDEKPSSVKSSITVRELGEFLETSSLPIDTIIRTVGKDEHLEHSPKSLIVLFEYLFKKGFRLSFSPW